MPDALEEGWYTDPYERHEARWFSEGQATKLVRDGGVEAYDDPPEGPPPGVAEKIVIDPPASLGPSDLLRADGPERIAPEWWRSDHAARSRDYYRLEDETGRRFWVYRAGLYQPEIPVHWFLHGFFA